MMQIFTPHLDPPLEKFCKPPPPRAADRGHPWFYNQVPFSFNSFEFHKLIIRASNFNYLN